MNANLENKTLGLNNPETHVLTYNRFNTYMVLIFTDLKKAQIYKIPYKNSPHQEIEIVTKIDYQQLFKPFDLDKEIDANFLFKIEDRKYIYVGEKVFSFETVDDIEEYFSETGNNDVKYPYALSKEIIYYMIHQKYITIEEFSNDEMEDEYQYLYKKDSDLKDDNVENDGIVEYGNDFLNCKIIDSQKLSRLYNNLRILT